MGHSVVLGGKKVHAGGMLFQIYFIGTFKYSHEFDEYKNFKKLLNKQNKLFKGKVYKKEGFE